MQRPRRSRLSVYQMKGKDVTKFLNEDSEARKNNRPPMSGMFRHQIEAVTRTSEFLSNPKNPSPALIIAPTGSGKTGIIALLPYILQSRRTMVLTPSPLISAQIAKAIALPLNDSTFLDKTGFFPGWKKSEKAAYLPQPLVVTSTDQIDGHGCDLVIVNAQKLGGIARTNVLKLFSNEDKDTRKRLKSFFRGVDLLIVDEAHHFPAPTWLNIKNAFEATNPGKNMVFITATVYRKWEGGIRRIFHESHDAYVLTKEALDAEVRRPVEFLDLPNDSREGSLALKEDLVDQVMKKLRDHDKIEHRYKHQALVTVRTTAEAIELSNIFNRKFPNSTKPITGGRIASEIEIREYKEGRFQVAVVCRMLIEGFDHPKISVCAIFKQNKSKLFFEQFLGRCMRRMRFENGPLDKTQAALLSYKCFRQAIYYEEISKPIVPADFPIDEDEEDTV